MRNIDILYLVLIAGLAGVIAALWSRVNTMHKDMVQAGKINSDNFDRFREKYYELARMLGHLADNFGLQYEVTPEQGRWVPADPMQRLSGMAQGYCADGSGDLARKQPEWRDAIERVHKELAGTTEHLLDRVKNAVDTLRHNGEVLRRDVGEKLEQLRNVSNHNWEAQHERLNELAEGLVKVITRISTVEERMPKPRIRVRKTRS